jgi:hypothetical protein
MLELKSGKEVEWKQTEPHCTFIVPVVQYSDLAKVFKMELA